MGRSVTELLGTPSSKNQPLERRVSPAILKRIDADFLEIIKAVESGQSAMPSQRKLITYFSEEYNIEIGPTSIINRMRKLSNARKKTSRKADAKRD